MNSHAHHALVAVTLAGVLIAATMEWLNPAPAPKTRLALSRPPMTAVPVSAVSHKITQTCSTVLFTAGLAAAMIHHDAALPMLSLGLSLLTCPVNPSATPRRADDDTETIDLSTVVFIDADDTAVR